MRVNYHNLNSKYTTGLEKDFINMKALFLLPYIYLERSEYAPIHAQSVYQIAEEVFSDTENALGPHQLNTPSGLRMSISKELNIKGMTIEDPTQLDAALKSSKWDQLCNMLYNWENFNWFQKDKLIFLLSRMGFYSYILNYEQDFNNFELSEDSAKCRVLARFINAKHKIKPNENTIKNLARILQYAPQGDPIRLSIAINIVVHYGKSGNYDKLNEWKEVLNNEYNNLICTNKDHEYIYRSMYYRALSYIPFFKGEKKVTEQYILKAINYANLVSRKEESSNMLFKENYHPLLETYAKVAQWLNDEQLSLQLLNKLQNHDYYDPKVHHRLGDFFYQKQNFEKALNLYKKALQFGAPYTAFSYFKMGLCFIQLGEKEKALNSFLSSSNYDKLGVSPLMYINELSKELGIEMVVRWSAEQLSTLKALKKSI
ncbi:hypothetical protein COC43_23150 [Bacillus thuringiensis]|uniref:tetratricopeptide repeat protein n=1 Tax=Bacillus thuringiensis TaxID=1428 RepID=UPI000BFDC0D0|nr:tetratricopeptide repeat protein [Bacillus thuringiensis]PGR73108.1 hypothetical protein COC43_23150 [Bacillus thuringiensis]